jgi:drug/metabolite transporter (DMT)-like permease
MKLAPVACSLCYAVSMTITKYTSSKDNVYTQMTHLYIGALIISTLFFIFAGKGQFNTFSDPTYQFIFREWFSNPSYAWPFIIGMGFIGAICISIVFLHAYTVLRLLRSFRLYEYSLIIWAIITGYLLFDNIPSPRTFVGVAIIIGAGIYIYIREKVRDQMIVTDTPNR